ncbi:MAG: prephenate dehydrogenase/arogenate dehydrogenase family protein [Chloroflexota bacterium]|jgi:prephenate dehydrogenase
MEDGFSLEHATVGILGLGLMGGSLALALKGKCARLIGFDPHPPTLELALSKKIIDHAEAFALSGGSSSEAYRDPQSKRLDILVIAAPVPAILNYLHQLQSTNYQPALSEAEGLPITLLDLGSTKRDIVRAMSALPANFDPIGGHPICGKEKLGLENADPHLYRGAPFVLAPLERTSPRAKSAAKQLISAVGAHPLEMTAEEHDRVLASTSHLPFLVSSALAHATPQEFAPLVGPGFRSASRLAGTPAHMMMGVLQSNRDNLLSAIRTFRNLLDEIESVLENEDYAQLEEFLNQSRSSYSLLTDN